MESQLQKFNERYKYQIILNKFNDEELKQLDVLSLIIDDTINNKLSMQMIYTFQNLIQHMQKDVRMMKLKKEIKNQRIGSSSIIGYLFCKSNKISWINCGCGDVGKFKKVVK